MIQVGDRVLLRTAPGCEGRVIRVKGNKALVYLDPLSVALRLARYDGSKDPEAWIKLENLIRSN